MRRALRHESLDEYFIIEAMSAVRHEYLDGQIYAMSGGSRTHNRIAHNVSGLFYVALRNSPCEPYGSDMRIRTPLGLYTYPDASIVCGEPDLMTVEGTDTIGNPIVLVEVLSESTRDYDRGEKFERYRSIPTLRDYVLIEQSRIGVEHRYRTDAGWATTTTDALDQSVRLTGVDLEMPLALIYERIEL